MPDEIPQVAPAGVNSAPQIPKTKRSKLKVIVITIVILGVVILAPIIFVFGYFVINSIQTATNTLPVSNEIKAPGLVFLENNKIYINDSGDHQTSSPGFRYTQPVIWVYEYPSGQFLDQVPSTDDDYERLKKIINKGYSDSNQIDFGPFKGDERYEITNSISKKTYTIESKKGQTFIGVYDGNNAKIEELNYDAVLIFNGLDNYVYFVTHKPPTIYKLDSKNDSVVLQKKIPIPNPEFGLGAYIDFTPYVTNKSAFFLPTVFNSDTESSELIIYEFMKDDFLKKIKLKGNFGSVFADDNDVFVSATRKGHVIWIDKKSGKIVKTFKGK